MFPKSIDTPCGRHLLNILNTAGESMKTWEMPRKDDYVLVGGFVVIYSYIDFHLKRLVEALEHTGKITKTKKNKRRSTADIAMAVQSVDWAPENLAALKQFEEFRGTRNILAHCVIRRFPEDDAFAFLFKSAEDYKEHFGTDPPYGMTMTAVVDRAQLLQILPEIERLQIWLSTATMQFEDQIEALSKPKV